MFESLHFHRIEISFFEKGFRLYAFGFPALLISTYLTMFVARFEWLAKVITFDMFSMMVDEALEQMRTMLDSNEAVQKLIANEAGEGSE